VTLAGVLSEIAGTYPEQNIRTISADATRVVAARHLVKAEGGDRVKLARAIVPLSLEDRLLARDVERFLNPPRHKPAEKKTPARITKDAVVVRRFHLPNGMSWRAAAADGGTFYTLAVGTHGFYGLRGAWDGRTQGASWTSLTAPDSEAAWSLHPMPGMQCAVVLPDPNVPHPLWFAANDVFAEKSMLCIPMWLPREHLHAVAHSDTGTTWARYDDSLRKYRSDTGALIATYPLQAPPPGVQTFMAASGEDIYVAWGTTLFRSANGAELELLPQTVRQITAPPAPWKSIVAIALEKGGMLIRRDGSRQSFGEGLADLLITFTRGGLLVAANSQAGRVYNIDATGCRCIGNFAGIGARPIALTPAHHLNEFAAFTADGSVTVFQIPV